MIHTLALFGWLAAAAPPTTPRFAIDLQASAGKAKQTTRTGPGVKPKTRPVLQARAGERVTVRWTVRNADAKLKIANVLVHFFVVKEEKVGQRTVPKLDKTLAESALTMDFRPRDSAEGEITFTVPRPGVYLIRVETLRDVDKPGAADSFAALDLIVR